MATADDSRLLQAAAARLPGPLAARPVVTLVGCVVVAGLLARLVALGARAHHWDEARVAYWTLYADQQGSFAYRRIIHGPFVQHTARWLYGLVGATDFASRLPVALVGASLPAVALLFRRRLSDGETVALAVFLAFNPVLLYYSRFMRSDVLVAAFALTTFGLCVRFLDERRPVYLYGVGAFAVLALSAKENALLYPVTWLGALVLLADRALDAPGSDTTGLHRALGAVRGVRDSLDVRRGVARYGPHLFGAAALAGLLFVFMFAPRGEGVSGLVYPTGQSDAPGLWEALFAPGKWLPLIEATGGQFLSEYGGWAGSTGGLTFDQYLRRIGGMVRALGWAGAVLSVSAVVGFVRERYAVPGGRPLVFLLFFAGLASLVGYPLGLSIGSGYKWNVTHVIVPLSVPAAVGLAAVARWLYRAADEGDPLDRGLVALFAGVVVVVAALQVGTLVYLNPSQDTNELVQHGQPASDLDPLIADLDAAAAEPGNGTDVLFYGNTSRSQSFVRPPAQQTDEGIIMNFSPTCTDWAQTLPLNWYLYRADVDADCTASTAELRDRVGRNSPALVVVEAADPSTPASLFAEDYVATDYSIRASDERVPRATVYVRADLAADP